MADKSAGRDRTSPMRLKISTSIPDQLFAAKVKRMVATMAEATKADRINFAQEILKAQLEPQKHEDTETNREEIEVHSQGEPRPKSTNIYLHFFVCSASLWLVDSADFGLKTLSPA